MPRSGPAVDARSVCRLELDLEPYRRPTDRTLAGQDRHRGPVVVEVVRVLMLPRLRPTPLGVEGERQPERPSEREGLAGLIDEALAIGNPAERRDACGRRRDIRTTAERAGHHDELGG